MAHELRDAIQSHGLSYVDVGMDVGLSGSQVSRVARGLSPDLSIVQAAKLLAAVGLEVSIRAYPTGRPLRDRAHLELLERLRHRLHGSLTWRTEVPVTRSGGGGTDLRAWDAVISGGDWSIAVEAETRIGDVQALQRRIELKRRDGAIDHVLLLVRHTRHNATVLRSVEPTFSTSFPLPGRRALELLIAGVELGSSSIVLI